MELRSRSTPCFSMDFLDDERGVDGEGDDSDGGGATRFEEWFDGQEGFHLTVDLGQAKEGGRSTGQPNSGIGSISAAVTVVTRRPRGRR